MLIIMISIMIMIIIIIIIMFPRHESAQVPMVAGGAPAPFLKWVSEWRAKRHIRTGRQAHAHARV